MAFPYNGMLLSTKKKQVTNTHDNGVEADKHSEQKETTVYIL